VQELGTPYPVIVLENGTQLPAVYEQSMGTNMLFESRQDQQHHLFAKTNAILRVDTSVIKSVKSKGPGKASGANPDTGPAAQEDAVHEQEAAVAPEPEQQAS
jgi:hypothetical protein